jgi:hypothetical protein
MTVTVRMRCILFDSGDGMEASRRKRTDPKQPLAEAHAEHFAGTIYRPILLHAEPEEPERRSAMADIPAELHAQQSVRIHLTGCTAVVTGKRVAT